MLQIAWEIIIRIVALKSTTSIYAIPTSLDRGFFRTWCTPTTSHYVCTMLADFVVFIAKSPSNPNKMVRTLYMSVSCSFFNDLWDAVFYVCCEIHRSNLWERSSAWNESWPPCSSTTTTTCCPVIGFLARPFVKRSEWKLCHVPLTV